MNLSIRTGIDLIRIARLKEISPSIRERFLNRVYTPRELEESGNNFEMLAGKFAAKEAVAKALGSGIGQVNWQDIEILHDAQGQPVLCFGEIAKKYAEELKLSGWSISISHESEYAVSVAVCFAAVQE